jgi:hypothetical protein
VHGRDTADNNTREDNIDGQHYIYGYVWDDREKQRGVGIRNRMNFVKSSARLLGIPGVYIYIPYREGPGVGGVDFIDFQ